MLYLLILVSIVSALGQGGVTLVQPIDVQRPSSPKSEPEQYKPEELCAVEGVVRNHLTGEPLKKANVILMRISDPRVNSQPSSTATNAEGKFAMKGIEPGQYRISVDRPGFVRTEYGARSGSILGGTTLTLEKGRSLKDVEFRMSPHSIITGRILDEDNEPVLYANVQLRKNRFFQGRMQLVPSGSAITNDLGEYRIFGVPAGKYYLSVSPQTYAVNYYVDRSADPKSDEGYAPTYYPGSSDIAVATLLNVPVGRTLQGMDISLRKTRTLRVSGSVSGVSIGRAQSGSITLTPKSSGDLNGYMDQTGTSFRGPKGEFQLRGVRPGSYILRANYFEPPDLRFSGRATIEVTNSHIEGVTLTLSPGTEVQGTIRLEGEGSLRLQDLSIVLQPRPGSNMMGGFNPGLVKEGGVFTIARVTPDVYTIRINGLPNEYYLKSARLGDTDILENGLDLEQSSAASGVDMVISAAAAVVDGSVVDEKGAPVKGAAVLLRPDTKKPELLALWRKIVTTDQNGQFKITGIAPGVYHLISFDGVDTMEAQDPELMQQHESAAVKLEIKPNGKESKNLKVISVKDSAQ